MNIYLHIEVSTRELDSKLLLGVIAASKGHEVLISDISEIDRGIRFGILNPGIFHTKSLTPSRNKISFHKKLIDKGFLITSLDEEAGLELESYKKFSDARYSKKTMDQSTAVFCWGNDDFKTLKKLYPKYKKKVIKTGSPRVDLWKSNFFDYWQLPNKKPKKPFLLVSSNMGASNGIKPIPDVVKFYREAGYFQRVPELFNEIFEEVAESSMKTSDFVEAIKYLVNNNKNNYDIVFRPHPVEDINAWKEYLKGIPNLHIIREGSITAWVNNAFAVMHNGCTTAFETSVMGKPLLTYLPFKRKYKKNISNQLGYKIHSLKSLSKKLDSLLKNYKLKKKTVNNKTITKLISKKIYLDKNAFASDKIVKVWEIINKKKSNLTTNWTNLFFLLKTIKVKNMFVDVVNKIFTGNLKSKKNWKFTPIDKNDINERVDKIKHVLNLKQNIYCKIISERAILIKKSKT
jgi:surface carbohydrate biosynthesis protein